MKNVYQYCLSNCRVL